MVGQKRKASPASPLSTQLPKKAQVTEQELSNGPSPGHQPRPNVPQMVQDPTVFQSDKQGGTKGSSAMQDVGADVAGTECMVNIFHGQITAWATETSLLKSRVQSQVS